MSLRVGLVCPYAWDVPGGVRSHVADLAVTLRGRGHSVNVLAPVEEESVLPDWVTDGGRPVAVPYNGSVARLSFGVKATRRVRAWIREGDFDIVHIHELAPSPSLLTCWSARGPLGATWHSRTIDRGSCRPGITSRNSYGEAARQHRRERRGLTDTRRACGR